MKLAPSGIGVPWIAYAETFLFMALLFGAWWLAKRFGSPFALRNQKNSQPIQVEAARSIGAHASLMVVSVADDRFLVAVSKHGITRIGRLKNPDNTLLDNDDQQRFSDSLS